MMCNSKAMVGVLVQTSSGVVLGRVASFDFEAETGRLSALHVKPRVMSLSSEFLIAWSAVIEMTLEKIVVMDGARPVRERGFAKIG